MTSDTATARGPDTDITTPLIRPFRDADLQPVLAIWLAANRQGRPSLGETFLTLELAQVRDVYLPASQVWVATEAGRIIGFTALMGHQLAGLFIAPAHQGKGLGRMFLDLAIAKRGDLEVDVFEANASARQLYDSYGFQLADSYVHGSIGHRVLRLTRLA